MLASMAMDCIARPIFRPVPKFLRGENEATLDPVSLIITAVNRQIMGDDSIYIGVGRGKQKSARKNRRSQGDSTWEGFMLFQRN